MYVVVKYQIYLQSLRNRLDPQRLAFLPVSKVRTNKFYIFRQCTYIVYLSMSHLISLRDLFSINRFNLFPKIMGRCVVKHIVVLLIKPITSSV